MTSIKLAAGLAALVALAGCTELNMAGPRVAEVRDAEGTGTPFTRSLTEEYKGLAIYESDEMLDWGDAEHFAWKGLKTAEGDLVLPEHVSDWKVPEENVAELGEARKHLMQALESGARDKQPQQAARAQARFDCWIEQQEENHQPDDIAACRDGFFTALASLEGAPVLAPAAAPATGTAMGTHVILFELDSTELDAAALTAVEDVIATAGEIGGARIALTGHADRAGPEAYNAGLSQRRADAVRDALVRGGAEPGGIEIIARGEAEPTVPTPDGVAEPANRRVEIMIR